MSDDAVLIFAKTPQAGRVKTRLIPQLGAEGAARLYSELLRREIGWLADETPYALEVWTTPHANHPFWQELGDRYRLSLHVQRGSDLGARMGQAARQALGRYRRVLLLGIDCPALTPSHLRQAFAWLAQGEDAVLGPAEDGGYVLLGLGRWHPALFEGHEWGGDSVAETTRRALRGIGWRWRELEVLWDLDRPRDLPRLRRLDIELPQAEAGRALPDK
jgi:rSAM/selenodomain-associated transferase 1